jgi:23S rRNA (cytidine1920-2'-O)/16S rRNA (cytidine1409-2'-O)-methyltransferase
VTTKQRADELLVKLGLAPSRSRAKALILAGYVMADGKIVTRAGQTLADDAVMELLGSDHEWASRGGLKLEHALDHFGFDPSGRVCLDVGASTGGFTDVLLARGAAKVYAVDVGRKQLDSRLTRDERVVAMEQTDCRDLTRERVPDPVEAIVCDVSFISAEKALPAALALAAPGAWLALLIKPQFEAGREHVGKGGIVRDPEVQDAVCERLTDWVAARPGWRVLGVTVCPLLGGDGNREFLLGARYEP